MDILHGFKVSPVLLLNLISPKNSLRTWSAFQKYLRLPDGAIQNLLSRESDMRKYNRVQADSLSKKLVPMSSNVLTEYKLKVIVADDHHLFRSGIIMALKKIHIVSQIREAENGREVLEILAQEHFDVVLMDISMPVMNGSIATKEISRKFPETKIIAVSMYEDDQHMTDMFHNGASGYLFKNTDKEEIKKALEEVVFNNNRYWPKKLGDKLFNRIILKKQTQDKSCNGLLSDREKEIISLICREFSTKEIASYLHLSQKTISWHRENLMQKTQSKNTAGLVAFAFTHEIVR